MIKGKRYDREHGRKNVLLITVDQWPGNLLGCNGRENFLSPTLDELTKVGVRFVNAYSPTPVCIPARRELMTGTCSRTHGDRKFNEFLEMPDNIPTVAKTFKNNGYQTCGVGKLHVYPQRDRIGFDDVILNEEGRKVNFPHEMREDDYTRFINREGYTGLDFAHGMSNNNYLTRPWHLPEYLHQTSWTSRQMCEQIIRRDPTKPAFWYCGFTAPHPPIVPPQVFLDMYNDVEIDLPHVGEWARDPAHYPYAAQYYSSLYNLKTAKYLKEARKGFYASCTQADYAIRSIIGTLRDEKILDNTIIAITSDHGEMLGNHNLWGKNNFYEDSAKVPFIIVPTLDCERLAVNSTDDRLVELKDMMPTLLDMCNLAIPESVEGMSLLDKNNRRDYVYGELWEDDRATRMIRKDRYKLIYYPIGNQFQLFDLVNDPDEMVDLSEHAGYKAVKQELTATLQSNLYGSDLQWLKEGELAGQPAKPFYYKPIQENCGILNNRDLMLQRGIR